MGWGGSSGLVCQSSQLQCWLCHNEVAVLCHLGHHTRCILMTTGDSSVECGDHTLRNNYCTTASVCVSLPAYVHEVCDGVCI